MRTIVTDEKHTAKKVQESEKKPVKELAQKTINKHDVKMLKK